MHSISKFPENKIVVLSGMYSEKPGISWKKSYWYTVFQVRVRKTMPLLCILNQKIASSCLPSEPFLSRDMDSKMVLKVVQSIKELI